MPEGLPEALQEWTEAKKAEDAAEHARDLADQADKAAEESRKAQDLASKADDQADAAERKLTEAEQRASDLESEAKGARAQQAQWEEAAKKDPSGVSARLAKEEAEKAAKLEAQAAEIRKNEIPPLTTNAKDERKKADDAAALARDKREAAGKAIGVALDAAKEAAATPRVGIYEGIVGGTHGHLNLTAEKGVSIGAGSYGPAGGSAKAGDAMHHATHVIAVGAGLAAIAGTGAIHKSVGKWIPTLMSMAAEAGVLFLAGKKPSAVIHAEGKGALIANRDAMVCSLMSASMAGGLMAHVVGGMSAFLGAGSDVVVAAGGVAWGKLELACGRGPVEIISKKKDVMIESKKKSIIAEAKENVQLIAETKNIKLEAHLADLTAFAKKNGHLNAGDQLTLNSKVVNLGEEKAAEGGGGHGKKGGHHAMSPTHSGRIHKLQGWIKETMGIHSEDLIDVTAQGTLKLCGGKEGNEWYLVLDRQKGIVLGKGAEAGKYPQIRIQPNNIFIAWNDTIQINLKENFLTLTNGDSKLVVTGDNIKLNGDRFTVDTY